MSVATSRVEVGVRDLKNMVSSKASISSRSCSLQCSRLRGAVSPELIGLLVGLGSTPQQNTNRRIAPI